jgi:hypothetical protein
MQSGALTPNRGQWIAQPRPQSAGACHEWHEDHSTMARPLYVDPAAARAAATYNGTAFHKMTAAGASAGSGAAIRHRHEYVNKFGSTIVAADAAPGRKLLFHAGNRAKKSLFSDADRASLSAARSLPALGGSNGFHEPPAVASPAPSKRPTFDRDAKYTRTAFATSSPRLLAWNPAGPAPSNSTYGFGTQRERAC